MKSRIIHNVFVLFLLLMTCNWVFPQKTEQILASTSGRYCRVKISEYRQLLDTLLINIDVVWINENLQPVSDQKSKLLLRREQVRTSAETMVTYLDFEQQDYIAFNRSYPLKLLLNRDFSGNGLKVEFNFEISDNPNNPSQRSDEYNLLFRDPQDLVCNAYIDPKLLAKAEKKPVEILLISPAAGADGRMVVKTAETDIIGYAKAQSGINLVLVNNEDARMYPDGKFVSAVKLAPGENEIRISAIDNDGAIIEKKITVVCESFAMAAQMLKAGDYYGLIIAVDEYDDPKINDLDHAVKDARALYDLLIKDYAFEKERTKLLINPKFEDIVIELDRLNTTLTENDNLLIFYAGHGVWSEQSNVGYWLPSNARESNTANWLRNSTLRDYIGSFKAKHTLLIADACFSGSIFKSRAAFSNAPAAIEKVYDLPSRKAMTSGSLSEVPDKSVFIEYLEKRLSENMKAYLTSEELFYSMKTAILNNSPTVPQFGEILNTGDEGGDFIFIRKK
jgi:Caspase domain/Glucodextranase, domain B